MNGIEEAKGTKDIIKKEGVLSADALFKSIINNGNQLREETPGDSIKEVHNLIKESKNIKNKIDMLEKEIFEYPYPDNLIKMDELKKIITEYFKCEKNMAYWSDYIVYNYLDKRNTALKLYKYFKYMKEAVKETQNKEENNCLKNNISEIIRGESNYITIEIDRLDDSITERKKSERYLDETIFKSNTSPDNINIVELKGFFRSWASEANQAFYIIDKYKEVCPILLYNYIKTKERELDNMLNK